jgi:hypothetical protein
MLIAQEAIVPRALAARDLLGFALLTPAIQQLVAFLPAQHKANVGFEQDLEPGTTGNLTIDRSGRSRTQLGRRA